MARVHSRDARFYVESRDLSGSAVGMDNEMARVLPDVTAFGDSGHRFLGARVSEDRFSVEVLYDDATDTGGTDAAFSDVVTSTAARVVTLWPAGDSRGRVGYGGEAVTGRRYALRARVAEVVAATADVEFGRSAERVTSLASRHQANTTATENTASVDHGAETTQGGAMYYHAFALSSSGLGWIVRLQHSSDNSAFANVVSSSAATGTTGARLSFTGSLLRYVRGRFELQGSSGVIQGQVSFYRGGDTR